MTTVNLADAEIESDAYQHFIAVLAEAIVVHVRASTRRGKALVCGADREYVTGILEREGEEYMMRESLTSSGIVPIRKWPVLTVGTRGHDGR